METEPTSSETAANVLNFISSPHLFLRQVCKFLRLVSITCSVAKYNVEFLTLLPTTCKCSSMTSLANFAAAAAIASFSSSHPGLLKKIANVYMNQGGSDAPPS